MFFQNRKQEEIRELKQLMEQTETEMGDKIQTLQKQLEETSENIRTQLDSLLEQGKNDEKILRRQTNSFEDLLDEIQSQRDEQNALGESLKEWRSREQALVSLVGCCRAQIALLERQFMQDSAMTEAKRNAWEKQFQIMEQEAKPFLRKCEIEETGFIGEIADYQIHEIVSVKETNEDGNNGLVAEVFSPGYLYQGRVMKKAQVAVYKTTH